MNELLLRNLENREDLIDSIKEEVVGPVLNFNNAIELSDDLSDNELNNGFYYWNYAGKKEEVFLGSKPSKKYIAGILYPLSNDSIEIEDEAGLKDAKERSLSEIESENVSSTNQASPQYVNSNMGITFAVKRDTKEITINFNAATYMPQDAYKGIQHKHKLKFWFRKSLSFTTNIEMDKEIITFKKQKLRTADGEEFNNITFRIDVLCRNVLLSGKNKEAKLVTVNITNDTEDYEKNDDKYLLFQSQISVKNKWGFLAYPNASQLKANISDEDKRFDMLYSQEFNYAFGQNCSATWEQSQNFINEIQTTFVPTYEIKTMTPDIEYRDLDGSLKSVEIFHSEIISCESQSKLENILAPLLNGYRLWLKNLKTLSIDDYYHQVFKENIREIEKCITRIERGIEILIDEKNESAYYAFKLTNLAMLMQMLNGKYTRKAEFSGDLIYFESDYENLFVDLNLKDDNAISTSMIKAIEKLDANHPFKNVKWRGFQIAYILMTIESIYDKTSLDREIVDLIWFPTGGGKTEAYLGLAAYSILYRRLKNPNDIGVDVIMRYTLRLLTADQFQRATRLVCSLDYIRSFQIEKIGEHPITIGLWVGKNTTPNKNRGLNSASQKLTEYINKGSSNFPIESCPWCGAEMKVNPKKSYHGYRFTNKLELYCPDSNCHFYNKLPISFVDEEMYNLKPTFLIGTVDKFVQLTWNEKARAFFGIGNDGKRVNSPPSLIIQDELHLISGPLGTLTGMYESLIEWLCKVDYNGKEILPKIVCATATVKSYKEQISALFGREQNKVKLFPPPGLDINDNFFSTVLMDKNTNKPFPGRKYIGIFPFTQGRLQTEVQIASALIYGSTKIDNVINEKDPYWTILSFYNTINDIGKAITLTEQDIPNTLNNYYFQKGIKNGRKLKDVMELTSRMPSNEVGRALSLMALPYNKSNSLDMVLASNIIEVGVDIDRLSLMMINGQPKTTAQYIQVSGRIGRKVNERPGLVVTIYNPLSSNDKSHFEHFNEYHQKLYSQVEELSVTPYSRFSIDRGLPAVIIGFLRQCFNIKTLGKSPMLEDDNVFEEFERFMRYIIKRAEIVDETEIDYLRESAQNFYISLESNDYDNWNYNSWDENSNGFMVPMTEEEEDVPENVRTIMFSMRSVDSISRLKLVKINSTFNEGNKRRFNF